MTTDSAPAGGDPRELLASARALTRRVRAAQRATWFPLLVLAAVTFGGALVLRYGPRHLTCQAGPGSGRVCLAYSPTLLVYWPVALVLAYIAVAALYLHRSRSLGVGTRVRPYVVAGIVIAAVVTGVSLWAVTHPYSTLPLLQQPRVVTQLFSGVGAIGLAMLVLSWAERNLALLGFTLVYLVVGLGGVTFGWTMASPWFFLPREVIDGSLLLLAGIGFALAQRRSPTAPPQPAPQQPL